MDNKPKKTSQSILLGPTMGMKDIFPERQLWEEIAKELNGEFRIGQTSGMVLEIHHLSIPYKKWTIEISVSDSRPLKFGISFESSQHFDLVLSWEDFIERIVKKFGKPEIEVGWKEFDKKYLIKSNRSDLTKLLLTKDIQKMLLKHEVCSVSYQTDQAKGTSELVSVIQRTSGDKEMILELVELFKSFIDNLASHRIIR